MNIVIADRFINKTNKKKWVNKNEVYKHDNNTIK